MPVRWCAASPGDWARPALPALYCAWAALAIGSSVALAGLSAESVTRLLVLAFLLAQLVLRPVLVRAFASRPPPVRFVLLGTLLAAVVEGFHMISTPVFGALRVDAATPPGQALANYAFDLAFTVPAYLVVFPVIWWCVTRWRFTTWGYVFVMGLAQALGDGGLFFFAANPAMLPFLPYPMTNYHAMNVIPFLAVRDGLGAPAASRGALLAVPVVIAAYLVCGAAIRVAGAIVGLE